MCIAMLSHFLPLLLDSGSRELERIRSFAGSKAAGGCKGYDAQRQPLGNGNQWPEQRTPPKATNPQIMIERPKLRPV